ASRWSFSFPSGAIETEPDGKLKDHREAAADRINPLATVNSHYFLVHFRFARVVHLVLLVLFLDLLNLGPHALHLNGRLVAGDAQREEDHIDDQRENDDGPAPIGYVGVQPL